MKREKLIFVVVFMVCSFAVGTVFAAYELQKPAWCVVDCGLSNTIGTGDYADGLDVGDSVGSRLDCSIGPLGEDDWMIYETASGYRVESGFYHLDSIPPALQIEDVSSDTIRMAIIKDPACDPSYTEYRIKVLSDGTTSYVQTDYTLGGYDEVFQTTSTTAGWGNPLTIINLTSNVGYEISVQAKNSNDYRTDYGASISTHTPCAIPGLRFANVTEDSANIIVREGNNSPETEYAIQGWSRNAVEQWVGYLDTNGSFYSDIRWHTKEDWGGESGIEVGLDLLNYDYRFQIKAKDNLNNKTDWSGDFYLYRITEPQIILRFPTGDELLSGLRNIEWESSHPVERVNIYYSTNGATFNLIVSSDSVYGTVNSYTWDTHNHTDGQYIIRIKDPMSSASAESGWFTIDNTPPYFTHTSVAPNPAKDGDKLQMRFTIVEENDIGTLAAKVILTIGSQQISDISLPVIVGSSHTYYASYAVQETVDPEGGEKEIYFHAEDLVGNTTDFYTPVVFDFEPPKVASYNIGEVSSNSIAISVEASDDDFWQYISTAVAVNYTNYNYICEGGGKSKNSGWIRDNSYSFESLSPNALYTLTVNLRDAARNENLSAMSTSTYTLCAVPEAPIISEVYASSMTVKINLGSNPQETRFSLAISSSAVTYYVHTDGSFDLNVTTATYSQWGGANGITITGLNPSTEYALKCRAMNNSGRFTDWGNAASFSTLCKPIEIAASKVPPAEPPEVYNHEWTNVTDFKFELTGASNYYYILNDAPTPPATYPNVIEGNQVNITISNSGTWYAHFKGENPTGTDETKAYYEVKVDTIPPELEGIRAWDTHDEELEEGEETTCHAPTFKFDISTDSLSEVVGYKYCFSLDADGKPDQMTEEYPVTISLDSSYTSGTYYFRTQAKDGAGNFSEIRTSTYNYRADSERPEATIEVKHKIERGNEVKGVEETNTPEIRFTDEKTGLLEEVWGVGDNVEVTAIRDNEGRGINIEIVCSITPDNEEVGLWKIDPREGWEGNYTYRIKVSTGIEDEATNNLKEKKELIFTTMLDHTKKNVVMWESEKKTKMILEAKALEEDGYILINLEPLPLKKGGAIEAKQVNPEVIIEADEKMKRSEDRYCYNLRESMRETSGYTTEGGEMAIETFLNTVYIELPYEDKDNNGLGNGIVDSTQETSAPVSEKTLSVYWLDEEHRLWVKVSGTEVDTKNKIARAKVVGFGVYTLMGGSFYELSDAKAFPVPYKPNDGNDSTGTEETGITFTGLSSEGEIKIYTITGELVKKLIYKNELTKTWQPVKNEKGEKVVSGVYIYYITNQKQHKSGKLVIIR